MVGGAEPLEAGPDRRLAQDEPDPRRRQRRGRRPSGSSLQERAGRTGSTAPGRRSRSPPPGCAGPRRGGPGAARARRPRAAGRSRGRGGRRPRTRATGCARATASRAGSRTWPPAIRSVARSGPGAVASRLAGRIACRKASRSAARTGAARRSLSIRSMIAASADELARRVQVEQLVDQVRAPSTAGKRPRRAGADLVDADVGVRAGRGRRRRAAPGAARDPPRWSRQTVQR